MVVVKPVRMAGSVIALMIIAALVFFILVPFIFIWALNALFTLNIQYTLISWFAAFIIMLILGWHKVMPVFVRS